MPPRGTKKDIKAVETRKVKTASKKKDPNKITNEEYKTLVNIFTEKLNRLQSIFMVDLPNKFKEFGNYNPNTEIYTMFGVEFQLYCNLKLTKIKDDLHLDFSCCYEPLSDSFLFNLEQPYNVTISVAKFNPFIIFDEWTAKTFSQFLNKYYDDGLDECIFNKNNINDAIKDIDSVLSIFYVNPTIGSPTNSKNDNYLNFLTKIHEVISNPRFTIINDSKLFSKFQNGGNLVNCELVLKFGLDKYKIKIQYGRSNGGEDSFTIHIHTWSTVNGWILIDHFSSKLLVFGKGEVSLKIENNYSYNNDNIYTKMLNFALNYIHKFGGYNSQYMFMDKK